MFIQQFKGKDIDKIADKFISCPYYVGIKYDGNYVQIHKIGNVVTFYTSSGKPFKLYDIEQELVELNPTIDFILEAEYIANTDGKLGSRGKCTTTTFRTRTSKGLRNNAGTNKFKVFDILYLNVDNSTLYACKIDDDTFEERYAHFKEHDIELGSNLSLVEFNLLTLDIAKSRANTYCNEGGEGLFLFSPSHVWRDKGRSNLAIKLKMKPRNTLTCIGVTEGEGKYTGMIGSLVLVDDNNITVSVGSGLSDIDRGKHTDYYIGSKVEIEYEQILDTYIQPRCIRIIK